MPGIIPCRPVEGVSSIIILSKSFEGKAIKIKRLTCGWSGIVFSQSLESMTKITFSIIIIPVFKINTAYGYIGSAVKRITFKCFLKIPSALRVGL